MPGMEKIPAMEFPTVSPRVSGKTTVRGMARSVVIRRDRFGIPSVDAEGERDAWFAMGFACAQDRLWQMEWYRRRGQGRWAEIAGRSGVPDDLVFRRLDLDAASRNDVKAMDRRTAEMFRAYAAGVNAFVESGCGLPPEFLLAGITPEPWAPCHSVLLFKVRHAIMGKRDLKLVRTELLRRIGADMYSRLECLEGAERNVILPPCGRAAAEPSGLSDPSEFSEIEEVLRLMERVGAEGSSSAGVAERDGGSNAWVVHGSRTTTGKPVLCNDSHRPLDVPNVYWPVRVACPDFRIAGAAFPGFPAFPHFGYNGSVAWAITHAMADTADLYPERFDGRDPPLYLTENGWRRAEVSRQTVKVRDGDPIELEVIRTRHGTIVAGDPRGGAAVALRSTATDRPCGQWSALGPMVRSADVPELLETQRAWVDPVNNLLAADTAGNIGYLTRGRVPKRPTREGRRFVVAGWTGRHEWTGDVPFERLPRSVNPESGVLLTANQRIRGFGGPYIANEFHPTVRAERIAQVLCPGRGSGTPCPGAGAQEAPVPDPRALGTLTFEQVAALQADTVSVAAVRWADFLGGVERLSGRAERARSLLAGWDGRLDAESGAALLYGCLRAELARLLFEPAVGAETWDWMTALESRAASSLMDAWLGGVTAGLPEEPRLPGGAAWREILPLALEGAWGRAGRLGGSQAPAEWRWGLCHGTRAAHPLSPVLPEHRGRLDPETVSMPGDGDTVRVASYATAQAAAGGAFDVESVSVYRQVVDLSAGGKIEWVIPGGASGLPGSPHSSDQLVLWRTDRLAEMFLDPRAAAELARTEHVLEPEEGGRTDGAR